MKIGLFIPNATFDLPGSSEVGGIEVAAFELGETLLDRGHEVILFGGIPKHGKRYRDTRLKVLLSPYIETKRIWNYGSRFRKLIQRLHFGSASMEWVRREKCDLMLIYKPYDFINAFRWRNLGTKVVMNYQGKDFYPTDRFWRRWIHWEFASSYENACLAQERYGALAETFPNGVTSSLFKPGSRQPVPGEFRVLTAGRLVGWKGLETLVPVVAAIPALRWEVAGDGPERLRIEDQAKKLGCLDRIQFHGVLSSHQLIARMQAVDVFAQPSIDFDACPTAVLQAMSCGLPVFMSDLVGLREEFRDREECCVITARDPEAWTQVMKAMMALPLGERAQMGINARRAIIHRFSWEGIAARLEARWKALLL